MVNIIVATDLGNVIGRSGQDMPWDRTMKDDLARFKQLTLNHVVIFGRRTFETIGSPLKDRVNVVISRQPDYAPPGVVVMAGLDSAIGAFSSTNRQLFICGGGEVYKQAMPYAWRIYLTRIHHSFGGDILFPDIDHRDWSLAYNENHRAGNRNAYPFSFQIWLRNNRVA